MNGKNKSTYAREGMHMEKHIIMIAVLVTICDSSFA
jgi:hypothetical protein